jgi:hypothetical protein
MKKYLNSAGDRVAWEALNVAEVSYCSQAAQPEVAIEGMTINEYVHKCWGRTGTWLLSTTRPFGRNLSKNRFAQIWLVDSEKPEIDLAGALRQARSFEAA